MQLLPEAVPESPPEPLAPDDPDEAAEPEEAPEPDEALDPDEPLEPFPPELEDVLALEDPLEPLEFEVASAPEPAPWPLDEPPLDASCEPPSGLLVLPLPQATEIRIAAIPAFARVRTPHKVAQRAGEGHFPSPECAPCAPYGHCVDGLDRC